MKKFLLVTILVAFLLLQGCDLLDDNNPKPEIPGKIVFSTNEKTKEPQVFKMNTDGSDLKNLTNFGKYSAFDPSWSPDGAKIVFTTTKKGAVSSDAIFIMNADGSNKRPMKKISSDLVYLGGNPVWSPNGSKIAFEDCVACSGGGINYEIFVYDFETDSVTRITNNYWKDRHPSWSPDGSKLAFSTEVAYVDSGLSGFKQDIYTLDLESRALERITESGNATDPNWSPDGRFITYQTAVGGVQAYLYDYETNGHKLLLPDFKTSGDVQWSNDGSLMLIQASKYERATDQSRFYKFTEGKYELIHIELKPARGTFKWFN